jgi:predicted  nucleic acid-binding Zn-ribbon protein
LEEKMKTLIALQDCDIRMRAIQIKEEEGPRKIQRLKEKLEVVEGQLAEEENRLEEFSRERRQAEQEIEDIENRLKKANVKLSNIKSNKEYQAALKEIEDLNKEKSVFEDKVINIMEQVEALQTNYASSRKNIEETRQQFELDHNELLKILKGLNKDLDKIEKKREQFSQAVDPGLLKKYDSLRTHKGGIGVSPVIKGICQTCHLGITPQEFNELLRGDKLMTCPNCTRIIYWGDDDRYKNDQVESKP